MFKAIASYLLYPLMEQQQNRQILSKLAALKAFSASSVKAQQQLIQQQLYEAVATAGRDVPYYRDLFSQQSFDPETLKKDVCYLKDLPYLTKDILKEQGERLLSEQGDRSSLHVRKTGGSTGPSALIYYDQSALDWTAAANLFVLELTGKKRYMKEAHFSSLFPDAISTQDRIKESIKCITLNRVNITTDSVEAESLRGALKVLRKERPFIVQGHPSTLYRLALQAERDSKASHRLFKAFESTGEVLSPKQFDKIETVFGCKIYDRYGNAEFGAIAHSKDTERQTLEVLMRIVWPESRAVNEGNRELVFTNLTNPAMPLIRYCTGDIGTLTRHGARAHITQIMGRVHDVVTIGDRPYPTHYIQDFLDRMGGIDEFQLEQVSDQTLKLKLILTPDADWQKIQHCINDKWGSKIAVEQIDSDELKLQGWRSKFRHLVSQPATNV